MDDDEQMADFGGEFYRWDCPDCANVNEEEFDPRGEEVECVDCPWTGKVRP